MSFIGPLQSFGTNAVKLAGGGVVGVVFPAITNVINSVASELFQKNNERDPCPGVENFLPITFATAIGSSLVMYAAFGTTEAVGAIVGSGMFMGFFIICSAVGGH